MTQHGETYDAENPYAAPQSLSTDMDASTSASPNSGTEELRAFVEVKAEGIEGEARLQMIRKRGGANLGSSLGFFFLFLVVMLAAGTALGFLLYAEV